MGLQTEFLPLTVDALPAFAADRKREGWRFVQLLAVSDRRRASTWCTRS